MILNLLSYFHMCIIFYSLSPMIIKNTCNDYIYIFFYLFVLLHWTFYKGECFISYYFKKIKDNNYKMGATVFNGDDDFHVIIPKNTIIRMFFLNLANIIIFYNLYNIFKHYNLNIKYYFMYLFLYVFYWNSIKLFKNHHNNNNYDKFNEIMRIIIVIYIICFYKYFITNIIK